jgi:hypothetical protein
MRWRPVGPVSAAQHRLPGLGRCARLVGDAATPDARSVSTSHAVTAGVDTHLEMYVAAVVDHRGLLATQAFPASTGGYVALGTWVERFRAVESIAWKARSLRVRPDPPCARLGLRASRVTGLIAPLDGVGQSDPIVRLLSGDREPTSSSGAVPVCPGAAGLPCNGPPCCCGGFARSGPGPCPAMLQCQR